MYAHRFLEDRVLKIAKVIGDEARLREGDGNIGC